MPGDALYDLVSLLVDASNKADAAAIIDESSFARALTVAGSVQILSAKLEFDGTDDWITAADSADWTFGTSDFTIEAFGVVFDAVGGSTSGTSQAIVSHYDTFSPVLNQRGWIFDQANGLLRFGGASSGGSAAVVVSFAWVPTLAQSYDLAVTRSGNTFSLYIDGARVATASNAISIFNSTSPLAVGGINTQGASGTSDDFDGRMSAIRITAAARYTGASYTVPTLPLPTTPETSPTQFINVTQAVVLTLMDSVPETNVTQAAVLTLFDSVPAVNVTQAVVLTLFDPTPPINITQAVMLTLYDPFPAPRVTQSVVLTLLLTAGCAVGQARLWRIQRRDGIELRFTSLDIDITYMGEVWESCGSLDPSAYEASAEPGGVGSQELVGLISSDQITEADLYAGLYDDAYVEVWDVDWRNPGEPRRKAAGWMGSLSHGETGFRFEVLGPGARLSQRPLIETMTAKCRWTRFGLDGCEGDAEGLKIAAAAVTGSNDRAVFFANVSDPGGATQWTYGIVRWLTGANAGHEREIESVDFATQTVTTWLPSPFRPQAGDTFDLLPGCDQTFTQCKIYGQAINNGGFHLMPGLDQAIKTPDAK